MHLMSNPCTVYFLDNSSTFKEKTQQIKVDLKIMFHTVSLYFTTWCISLKPQMNHLYQQCCKQWLFLATSPTKKFIQFWEYLWKDPLL